MKRGSILTVLVSIVLVISFIVMGCGGGSTTAAQTGPIKIGHIFNMTGPEAIVGSMEKTGFDYAFKSVNYQVDGREIQVIEGDAGGAPATSVDVARKMVEQDKVVAIFGPTEIGQKNAVAGYCKQAKIPLILYNPTPSSILENNKWVIAAGGTNLQSPSCMGDYLFTQLGYKTITTVTQDDSAGRAFMDPLTKVFTANGGTVVQQQWVAAGTTDFAPYLNAVKDAEALVAWMPGDGAIKFLTQFHQLGIDKKMPVHGAFHGGFIDPFIPAQMAEEDAEALIAGEASAPSMWDPDNQDPVNLAFIKGFRAIAKQPPTDDTTAEPAQAAMLFQAALKTSKGNTAPDKLLAALTSTPIVGPCGPMSFAGGKQAKTANVYIVKITHPAAFIYKTVYTYKDVPPEGFTVKK